MQAGRGLRQGGGKEQVALQELRDAGRRRWTLPQLWPGPFLALESARGQLLPFAPVLLGVGIGIYFLLPVEPDGHARLALALLVCGLGAVALRGPMALRLPAMAAALLIGGVVLSSWRAHQVSATVLAGRYYGPIEGRVIGVDRSASDALRLTLDQVVLPGRSPARSPERLRISLHGPSPETEPIAGTRIALTGHLGPPGGPVEPGGFDYRRMAWFERLGAVGYTRSPVVILADPLPGFDLAVTRLRLSLSAALRTRLPGEAGGFVAAILTGDRSGVGPDMTEALRRSNLAHLLAISGLHMGLLTGVIYGGLRGGLALIPFLALRFPIRKLAAIGALGAAGFYLALSGGNVATQRAFVMVAVMLVAVLLDRQAISLRSVAIAALLVLALRPESLLSAGFQMSFAATVALVAVFGLLRAPVADLARHAGTHRTRRRAPWALIRLRDLVLCSLVAGMATAPIAAAQFHRLADYGLLANLLSMPLMGAVVMPAAVLSALLWPLGLEAVGLWLMQAGTRWILAVAQWVSGLDGAVRPIAAPPGWVMPILALGALWLILWPGRARFLGIAAMAVAALGWGGASRPAVLISGDGALVGVMTHAGRALSRPRGAGFVARNWLAADGDGASQAEAAARPGFTPVEGGVAIELAEGQLVHLFGRGGPPALAGHCRAGTIIVLAARHDEPVPGDCLLLDQGALRETGSVVLPEGSAAPVMSTAAVRAGQRPWTTRR